MQALLSRLSKLRMFMSKYGHKIGQRVQSPGFVSISVHTLTETKCGQAAIVPDEFDMKASHRLWVSIQRPGHLE